VAASSVLHSGPSRANIPAAMSRYLITALFVVFAIDSASAQISDHQRQALNNTQHEMTTCAVFFSMMRQCIINRGRPKEDGKLCRMQMAQLTDYSKTPQASGCHSE
jgi:hypothetical protein